MIKEDKEALGYFGIVEEEFTKQEIKIFVECLMVGEINSEWILKCLTAVALNIGLSEEEYEETEIIPAEGEEEEQTETFMTSDFIKFVDDSLLYLILSKDKDRWIRLLRDALLYVENYEMLDYLKLEKQWNI